MPNPRLNNIVDERSSAIWGLFANAVAAVLLGVGCTTGPVDDPDAAPVRQEMLVVVEENAGRVTLLDLQTEAILDRIEVDSLPHEVEVSADGRTAYVSNFGLRDYDLRIGEPGGTVAVIDLVRGKHSGHLWLAGDSLKDRGGRSPSRAPHGLKLRPPAGRELFVNAEVGDSMVVFDVTNRRRLRAFALPAGTHNFVFSANGDTLWLMAAAAGVYRVDPVTGQVTGHVPTPTPARGLTWTPDGKHLLVAGRGELLMINPVSLGVEERFGDLGVGQILYASGTPDGRYFLAPAPRDSLVVVVDRASGQVIHRLRTGLAPIRVLVEPGGRRAYVANAEDEHVSVIDLRTFTLSRMGQVGGPNGLVVVAR